MMHSRKSGSFFQGPGRESARQNKEYALVRATLVQRTDDAILLTNDKAITAVWVPKYALNVAGRVAEARAPLKAEIEVGVELKMAESKGLI